MLEDKESQNLEKTNIELCMLLCGCWVRFAMVRDLCLGFDFVVRNRNSEL